MNAAKNPIVEFGHVGDFGRTDGPGSLELSLAAGKVREFLVSQRSLQTAALSILPGLIGSMAGSVGMLESDRWADPVGTRRDVAVLRYAVAPRRAGSRSHGPVR